MSVFVQQLRELLGVPAASFPTDSGEKGGNETGPGTNAVRILPAASGIAKWELDALLRQRTYENLAKVSNHAGTENETASLTNQLTNLSPRPRPAS
jgi:hypothetical protein